jgi:glycosyltransferase involved in cell wall biosynthesis
LGGRGAPGYDVVSGIPRGDAVKISIITPSFNQGVFIERTIESVLAQRGDFETEYLVVDAGSTDTTLSVLRRYEGRLCYVSEPDRGQCDAINKGLRMTTGEVVAWLNSDDTYEPGALAQVAAAFRDGAAWCFGMCRIIDEDDREIRRAITRYKHAQSQRYSIRRLLGRNFISQPATFFRRELLARIGGLDENLHLAMDYDLTLRFARVAPPVFVPRPLATFRWHPASKTGAHYRAGAWEAFRIACRHARGLERLALPGHLARYAAQIAVYRALDLTAARRVPRCSG